MDVEKYLCSDCGARFTRKWNFVRHFERLHSGNPSFFSCDYCHHIFREKQQYLDHIETHRPHNNFKKAQEALGVVAIYERSYQNVDTVEEAFQHRREIRQILHHELQTKNVVKASLNLLATFQRFGSEGTVVDQVNITLHSKYYTLYRMQKLRPFIRQCKNDVLKRMEDLTLNGSNWTLYRIRKMRISLGKVKDLTEHSN